MTQLLATTLPEHSSDGYVAAAYIVFFAIVLIYVAIMAVRLGRVERKVEELRGEATKSDIPPARARGIADLDESNPNPALPDKGQEHALEGVPHGGGRSEGHRQAGRPL
ncbi:MAG TPA: hypothetical protein VIJ50_08150 [Solirubrobacteraceae bacterium]